MSLSTYRLSSSFGRACIVRSLRGLVIASLAVLTASHAHATAINFNLTTASSTLDLTANGTLQGAPLTVTEQNSTAKANTYSTPSGSALNSNVYTTAIAFPGGSNAVAGVQKGGFLGQAVNLAPGIGGVGPNAPGNYGVSLTYPLATPIKLPAIPIGNYGTVSPGSITGVQGNLALRNLALDFTSGNIPLTVGAPPTNFDPTQVGVSFAAGDADVSFGAVLNIAGITGLGSFFDSLARPVVEAALASAIPSTNGVVVSFTNGTGPTDILISTGTTTSLSALGGLPNTATGTGLIQHISNSWKLTLPVDINIGALVPANVSSTLGLSLSMELKGQMVGTATYQAASIVPEPSTWALAASGMIGLAGWQARRRLARWAS